MGQLSLVLQHVADLGSPWPLKEVIRRLMAPHTYGMLNPLSEYMISRNAGLF